MAKFQGPAHISSIHLSSGVAAVEGGVVSITEPTAGDVANLRANGFELVAEGAYFALPAAAPEAEPASPKPTAAPAPEAPIPPASDEPASA